MRRLELLEAVACAATAAVSAVDGAAEAAAERAAALLDALQDALRCALAQSTPLGEGLAFANTCKSLEHSWMAEARAALQAKSGWKAQHACAAALYNATL